MESECMVTTLPPATSSCPPVKAFRLIVESGGLVLRGRCLKYHAKQVAQHVDMERSKLPILANEIIVVRGGEP